MVNTRAACMVTSNARTIQECYMHILATKTIILFSHINSELYVPIGAQINKQRQRIGRTLQLQMTELKTAQTNGERAHWLNLQ